jgi:nucleobase:cation symporter-1, NCS1 family
MLTVWVPWFAVLSGFNWVIGAVLGGVIYNLIAKAPART